MVKTRKFVKLEALRELDPALAERVEATLIGARAARIVPIDLEDLEIARKIISGEFDHASGRGAGGRAKGALNHLGKVARKYFAESAAPRRLVLDWISRTQAAVSGPSVVVPPEESTSTNPGYDMEFLSKEFICPECGESMKGPQGLGTHRQSAHGVESKKTKSKRGWRFRLVKGKAKCPFCTMKFSMASGDPVGSKIGHIKSKHLAEYERLEEEDEAAEAARKKSDGKAIA
jgi:rubredoxin